ncbi:uncharacterized protein LOC130531998 isoform X1 [Takifugu flavidus]|uniref:uncharacterized protein LOC130531998 isoform X1 n=1 Tax=Takifugu flavidus TaxID=433684 RepID=UPI002544791C|nr:uncharacterized protein LOC130531998 isoform X1 [Takifugu flavidus]
MENWKTGDMRSRKKFSQFSLLFLALIQTITCTSAPSTSHLSYLTRPENVSVAVGEPAVFRCGVPESSPNVTFRFYGTHGSYSLTCPDGKVEDVPQALYGSCNVKNGELMAMWTLKGTSFSDNHTRVTCQGPKSTEAPSAFLHVHDKGTSFFILIGCVIGGFFGTLLVAALAYLTLQNSESVQNCFKGKEIEEDLTTIVTKD